MFPYLIMDKVDLAGDLDNSLVIKCHSINLPEECESQIHANSKLKLLTYNIRSINLHFDEFQVLLKRLRIIFDIIILTECWLGEHTLVPVLDGYTAYRSTVYFNKAGGVVVYVRNPISASMFEPNFNGANCIILELPGNTNIIAIYRSPSETPHEFLNSLQDLLSSLSKDKKTVILAGDVNIDLLSDDDRYKRSDYLCLTAENGLIPAITQPTRHDSCLDHIFLSSYLTAQGIICKTDITDHDLAIVSIDLVVKPKPLTRLRIKIDHNAIDRELSNIDWSSVLNEDSVERATESFSTIVSGVVDNNSKTVKLTRSKFNLKPWITPGLIRCMKNRDALHCKSRKNPNNEVLKLTYSRYRNFCNNLLYQLKHDHERKTLQENKNDPKKLWSSIKDICYSKKQISAANELLNISGDPISSLNQCNEYFTSVGKNLAVRILEDMNETEDSLVSKISIDQSPGDTIFLQPTDGEEIGCLIQQLSSSNASGTDGISNCILKSLKDYVVKPLAHIINLSMSTGQFPEVWKSSLVCPIHKAGPKDDPSNYRPISLLPTFSKLLEKVVNQRLVGFLEQKNLLHHRQFGFRKGISTEDAVSSLVRRVCSLLDDGNPCIGVFLDLAKAFDTVSTPILLEKLHKMGIRGTVLAWFQSYLSHRQQYLKVGTHRSSPRTVSFGVPQGSILGPTLFLMYINDISSIHLPKADLFSYADDTAIIFHDKSWRKAFDSAENGMSNVASWLRKNLLTLNTAKTKYVCFYKTEASAPTSLPGIKIHKCGNKHSQCQCPEISNAASMIYLGITLDKNLNFREHIQALSGRVRKIIYIMKELRNRADYELLTNVYTAICEPILTYCISVWGGANNTVLLNVERAQRSLLKVMFRKPRMYPTDLIHSENKILSVRRLYILKSVILMHKNITKSSLYNKLLTKRVYQIPIHAVNTTFAQRFPDSSHPHIYNKVNSVCDFRNCSTFEVKRKCQKWLLSLSYNEAESVLSISE